VAVVNGYPVHSEHLQHEVIHAGLSGSLAIADNNATYAGTPTGGMVFEDAETVRSLTIRFNTIRGEARPTNELAAILSKARPHLDGASCRSTRTGRAVSPW
jgi:hypothetical protein